MVKATATGAIGSDDPQVEHGSAAQAVPPAGATTLLLLLAAAVIGSNALVLSPILPDVAVAFDATPLVVSRAIAGYGAATALSALLLGFTIDRHGARAVLLAGAGLLAVATFASAASTGWVMLVGAQALAGVAAGVMLPAIYASATAIGAAEDGARVLGRVLAGWSVSLVAGVPASALIADAFGWRAPFAVLGALVLLAAFGLTRLPRDARTSGSAAPGRSILAGPARAVRIAGVPTLLAVQFLFMTAFYGTYAFFGDHLRGSLDLSASVAGLVVLAYGVRFGVAVLGDTWIDRIGAARVLPVGLVLVALAYATMPLTTAALAGAALAAFAWGLANHVVLNVVVLRLSAAAGEARGAVLGLNSAVSYAGALMGPLVLGRLYAAWGFSALALGAAGCAAIAVGPALLHRTQPRPTA